MPLIAGNWKMNLNHLKNLLLVQKLALAKCYKRVEVWCCPPLTHIRSVQTMIDGDQLCWCTAPRTCPRTRPAPTPASVGGAMLAKLGCSYVVVGPLGAPRAARRGRRAGQQEGAAALKPASCPILCVGEGLEVREAGGHVEHTTAQLKAALKKVPAEQVADDGDRLRAGVGDRHRPGRRPADAQEVCAALRQTVAGLYGEEAAGQVRCSTAAR